MNKDIFQGKWEEVSGKMRMLWGKLTDDDVQKIKGNQQEIYGTLHKYYGYSKEEAEKAVKQFQDKHIKS